MTSPGQITIKLDPVSPGKVNYSVESSPELTAEQVLDALIVATEMVRMSVNHAPTPSADPPSGA